MQEPPTIPGQRDEFERWCLEASIEVVVVGASDTNGSWIGKRVPLADFLRMYDGHGVSFCDVFWVTTRDGLDVVEPTPELTSYFPTKANGYPDIFLRPELTTARLLSWHDATVAVSGTFRLPDGGPVPIDPRVVLERQVERASSHGIETRFASEFEFYVFQGDPEEIRKGGHNLSPLSDRPYTYQVYRSSIDSKLLHGWTKHLAQAGVHVEALNPETGPGQYELNTSYTDAMRAADDAFMYKNAIKELAAMDGMSASFMALMRPEWAGSSCHLHQSLWSQETGEPIFGVFSEGARAGVELSETGAHYVAGVLATLREFSALYWPTVNSYRRAKPYSWAATTATWGYDNRSTGLRIVGEDPRSYRLENRMSGADVNPYIGVSASLAGGLYGIEHGLELASAYVGDAYGDATLETLPKSLEVALDLLEASEVARKYLGDDFVNHYVLMKRAEVEEFREQVSAWELETYFETA